MSMTTTLIVLGVAVVLGGFANWRSRKPYVPGKPPLLPYAMVQYLAILVVILMLGHMISLITGEPFKGRRMP